LTKHSLGLRLLKQIATLARIAEVKSASIAKRTAPSKLRSLIRGLVA